MWNLYSPETLLRWVRIIMEGAFEGYRRLVEEYFSRLAPHLRVAATLPARLEGTLLLRHLNERPDLHPPRVDACSVERRELTVKVLLDGAGCGVAQRAGHESKVSRQR